MRAVYHAVKQRPPPAGTPPPPPPPLPPSGLRCHRRRRPAIVPHSSGAGEQQQGGLDPQDLLQRAEALRARQAALEQEAAQLAAALEGLPAAEQRAVLEALGAQREAQQQGGPTQERQQQQQQEQQQRVGDASAALGQGAPAPDAWEAALPPQVRQAIREAGMEDTLRQHAEAVRRDLGEEWEATGKGSGEALLRGWWCRWLGWRGVEDPGSFTSWHHGAAACKRGAFCLSPCCLLPPAAPAIAASAR